MWILLKTRWFSTFPLLVVLALSAASGLTGCAGKSIDDNDPAALFQDAEEDIQNDHYQMALDKLRSIKNKFPYSKYSIDARLRMADVYFLQEAYSEAAMAYEAFRDLYPKHERVPYAMFRTGLSYYKDVPGNIARDLSPAQKAMVAYEDFLKAFPTSPDAPEAKKNLAEVRNVLAQKEIYIGDFYRKNDQYEAARTRYQRVLEAFPDTESAKTASERLSGLPKPAPKPVSAKE